MKMKNSKAGQALAPVGRVDRSMTSGRNTLGVFGLVALLSWAPAARAEDTTPPAAPEAQTTAVAADAAPAAEAAAAVDQPALPQSVETSTTTNEAPPMAQVRTISPPVANPARDAFDAAIQEAQEGERQKLIAAFRALESDAELGAYATHNLGVLAWERGERDEAVRYFQAALQKSPGFGPSMVALVRDALSRGDVSAAEELVRTQREASSNASGVRSAALYIALHRQDWAVVVRDTRSVLIDNPTDMDAHYALAMAYLEMGRVELAEYVLNMATKRDASRADLQYGLGRVALRRGRTEEARGFFEAAVQRAPAFPEANIDLAALRLAKMDYAPVVSAMEVVTRVLPNSSQAWVTLGSGLKGMRRYAEAKAAFERALELDPRSWAAVFNLGILYLDVQGFEDLDQLARMARVSEYFARYRELRGTIPANDPVTGYEAYVREEIAMQEDLARQAAEDAERARRRAEQEAERARQAEESGTTPEEGGGTSGDDWDDW